MHKQVVDESGMNIEGITDMIKTFCRLPTIISYSPPAGEGRRSKRTDRPRLGIPRRIRT